MRKKPPRAAYRVTRRPMTRDDQVAIGELVKAATGICAVSKNRAVFALGAILAERAANIWRGEVTPYVATRADLRAFAQAWDVETRAAFNPKKQIRSRSKTR
jgi:hypothetical protein